MKKYFECQRIVKNKIIRKDTVWSDKNMVQETHYRLVFIIV